jgi:hypothetical protein
MFSGLCIFTFQITFVDAGKKKLCEVILMMSKVTHKNLTNSFALVRKRTILTERPPLVGEVSANFSR